MVGWTRRLPNLKFGLPLLSGGDNRGDSSGGTDVSGGGARTS